jgi:hypothetical protein
VRVYVSVFSVWDLDTSTTRRPRFVVPTQKEKDPGVVAREICSRTKEKNANEPQITIIHYYAIRQDHIPPIIAMYVRDIPIGINNGILKKKRNICKLRRSVSISDPSNFLTPTPHATAR